MSEMWSSELYLCMGMLEVWLFRTKGGGEEMSKKMYEERAEELRKRISVNKKKAVTYLRMISDLVALEDTDPDIWKVMWQELLEIMGTDRSYGRLIDDIGDLKATEKELSGL